MDEFEIIRRYFSRPTSDRQIRIGVGDDGAVLSPPAGSELISVVDTQVAGVHFPRDLGAADIGYRSVAVNLSDIAAMGGRPHWMTLALTLPDACAKPDWLQDFANGLFECCDTFGVSLVGGDTTSGTELVVSVQLMGSVAAGAAITRSGGKPGDLIFVTGTPGDAAAGLHLHQNGETHDAAQVLFNRFRRPEPRVTVGEMLVSLASAAIDVSDGLFADLGKMLHASRVAGQIEVQKLPASGAILALFDRDRRIRFALSGGDDYELCFTVAPKLRRGVIALQEATGIPVSEIGSVSSGAGLVCTDGGEVMDFSDEGFLHFS